MNILGPDTLVFGVDDVAACAQYLTDYGLMPVNVSERGGKFEALDGTSIVIAHRSNPSLPPALPTATMLRKTVYGVADVATVAAQPQQRIPLAAWIVAGVVVCLTLNQSMVFAFVERVGVDRGFGAERINGVLIALGLVNLTPGILAAVLQKRLAPLSVGLFGPIGQAVLALTIMNSLSFMPYAVATSLYVFMVIFTHAFLFGLLARLDPSGRAVAATPAMMMVGSCIGPGVAGALVHGIGYPAVGVAVCCVSFVAVLAITQVRRRLAGSTLAPVMAAA